MAEGDIVAEPMRSLNGTFRGSHWRLVSAGDGFVKEFVWRCPHRHATALDAELCAKLSMATDASGVDR